MNSKVIFSAILLLALLSDSVCSAIRSTKEAVIIHNISINKISKEILVDATLSIDQGILEYLLVTDTGKAYESALKLQGNKPSDLNVALLLIGCKALPFNELKNYMGNGVTQEHWNATIKDAVLEITLKIDGTSYPVDTLISSREDQPGDFVWIYTGGMVIKDKGYAGDFEYSYIAIWPDPVCPINLLSKSKNPYKGNFGFEINPKIEIKKNAKVQIIIRKKNNDEQQRTDAAQNSQ